MCVYLLGSHDCVLQRISWGVGTPSTFLFRLPSSPHGSEHSVQETPLKGSITQRHTNSKHTWMVTIMYTFRCMHILCLGKLDDH